MNKDFQRINIEDVIFFDTEVVRANDKLELDTKEYELFQRKTRDRSTDEFLADKELVEEYDKRAGLKRVYNKIITVGIGVVKDGEVYIKHISGNEEDVIREVVDRMNEYKYNCGFNSIAFDLPVLVGNGMKYFNIAEELKDDFNPSGKKPWNLTKCIDLLEVFKGTHYYPNSLDEVCYHFDIPTPKDDISGAEVSDVYYNGDKDRIYEYVKKDVFANINIFCKMQGKDIFENFVDRSGTEEKIEELPILTAILNRGKILAKEYKQLEKTAKELDPSEVANFKRIIQSALSKKEKDYGVKEIALFEKLDNLIK